MRLVHSAMAILGGAMVALALTSCGGGGDPAGDAAISSSATQRARAQAQAAVIQAAGLARWSPVVNLPLVPSSGAPLANGKLLLWAANSGFNFNAPGHTLTALFDPATNAATARDVFTTGHDMFCAGTARLPDGRLLVNGGYDSGVSSLYDPQADSWSLAAPMNIPRGYAGSVPLADGTVMTLGGSWSGGANGKDAEIYDPARGWRRLTGVPGNAFLLNNTYSGWQSDSHANLIPSGNGKVLFAGPAAEMKWIDPRGNGSITTAGPRGDDSDSLAMSTVMFDTGRILKVGGAPWNSAAAANANAFVIDTRQGVAAVQRINSMAYPRIYASGVVLPNGQVVVIGGQTAPKEFSDDFAVLPPELFDPVTNTFAVMPAMSVPRNYHSIGLLLPDARVVSAGGGLCDCAADHPNLQILSPPYLFNADGSAASRPAITAAPTEAGYGSAISVQTDVPVTAFSLVRLGAATHTVNNDQRRLSLTYTALDDTRYPVNLPSNPGWMLPGQWMLFAMNAQGTPSVARIITVSRQGAPVLEQPENPVVTQGQPMSLALQATTPSGSLSFSASGLPAGLSIDPVTGRISGIPATAGRYVVSVVASNGVQSISTDMVIDVSSVASGSGLLGEYFGNPSLSGVPVLRRTEAVDFIWGDSAPGPGLPADGFSVRWRGFIEAPVSGPTLLQTISDDGVRLWVDNRLVIDNWTVHGATANTATVLLEAGRRHAVLLEYFDSGFAAQLQLRWQPPGATALTSVPANRLYPAAPVSVTNLARGQPALQSSTQYDGVASRAVDGNTDGNWGGNSVTHTQSASAQDWWQVDLGRLSRIDLVQLWNRTDCCGDRLNNFQVLVSATDMNGRTLADLLADPAVGKRSVGVSSVSPVIGIPINGTGRFVRVQLTGQNILSLAEVQVFGTLGVFNTPSITPVGDLQSVIGAPVSLQISASDPDGNPLTFGASGLPPGTAIDPATGLVSGSLSAAGTYNVVISASNEGGLSASTAFTVKVLDIVPQIQSVFVPAVPRGTSANLAPVMLPGEPAEYSWDYGDGTPPTAYSSTLATSHVYSSAGVYEVTLSIRTLDGRTAVNRFLQAVTSGGVPQPSASSGDLLLEPIAGGPGRLWVSNADNDSVSVFDLLSGAQLAEVPVGQTPRALALASDGRIWVTNQRSASISVISPLSLSVVQTLALPRASQPYGLVISPGDGNAFVALQARGQVLKLNGVTGAPLASLSLGDNPRHLAINSAADRLLVSRFITRPLRDEGTAKVKTTDVNGNKLGGEVWLVRASDLKLMSTAVLAHSNRPDSESQGRGIPNYLGAPAVSPDGKTAWIPSKQDNLLRGTLRDGRGLDFQNTVRAISSRIDVKSGVEDLGARVDHDNASLASAARYHPNGAYLFVALETSRQVAVLDAAGRRELFRYEVGLAPQGLAVSGDGLTLFVHNAMGRTISVLDLRPLIENGNRSPVLAFTGATVAVDKLPPAVLRGKQLFYDARDPRLARDNYMSCASCHNDGGHDGRVWDLTGFGEGLRNTIALRGRAALGHGFLHWSANFDELQDFEAQIRNLAGGTGLMSDADFNTGNRNQPLGDRKAGLSADLDALAAYVASLGNFDPAPARTADGALTPSAAAGKLVFQARNCASCHSGTAFTGSTDGSGLKNVGTLRPSSGQRLGGPLLGIDVPTLRDVWATAPYLHDGSAPTLADAVKRHSGVKMGATDLANLVDYLMQIGAEEAGP